MPPEDTEVALERRGLEREDLFADFPALISRSEVRILFSSKNASTLSVKRMRNMVPLSEMTSMVSGLA